MSSSATNSTHTETSDNLNAFSHLPFSSSLFYPRLLSQSDQISVNSAFIQIPSFPTPDQQLREINRTSVFQTHSLSNSTSSIPDLVPNTDYHRDPTEPDLFHVHNTFDLSSLETHLDTSTTTLATQPPPYTTSDENPPSYHPPWAREIILRRIRILQREATDLYRQIDQRRNESVAIYNAAVDTQLRHHDSQYQTNIEHLEDLLDLWLEN